MDVDRLRKLFEDNGLRVRSELEIEVKTSRGWIAFHVFDVTGFVEGLASYIATLYNVVALEAGKHLILGEVSAKLWDEAVKIVFPDGKSETIAIFTFDGFLDVRMPTGNVRGVKPQMVIGGKTYDLPLSLEDIVEIYGISKDYLEKIEKAASIYGLSRIISSDAIKELRNIKKKEGIERKVEIDYESGYVLILEGRKIVTKNIERYVTELLEEGRVEEAYGIYENAPQELKKDITEAVKDLYYLRKISGADTNSIVRFCEKANIKLVED